MLNDIKNWLTDKGEDTKQTVQGAVAEIQNDNFMDWSGTVWILIGIVAVIVLFGIFGRD